MAYYYSHVFSLILTMTYFYEEVTHARTMENE